MFNKKSPKIIDIIDTKIKSLKKIKKDKTLVRKINETIKIIHKGINNHGKLMIIGNGGSAADSQHMAAELVGKYLKLRKPIPAISMSTDTSILTSISNDLSFNKIFTRQFEALKKKNDILLAITTSGKSKNIIHTLKLAKKNKIKSVCLTSIKAPKELDKMCDIVIRAPASRVDRIQELHLFIEHFICEELENLIK